MNKTMRIVITFLLFTFSTIYGVVVPYKIYYENEKGMENHPGDFPFPTDVTFSNFADHKILATTKEFHPSKVKCGDTIYLKDRYISWFISHIHPKIKYPYILISSDSDDQHPYLRKDIEILLYDSKLAAWFCKNMILSRHPKIFQIPIGQNIVYWGFFPEKNFLLQLAESFVKKEYLLYVNMQLASDKSRAKIAKLFEKEPYCFSRINYKDPSAANIKRLNFYNELSKASFVAAPRGYGIDTARFWEALTVNTIPIVQYSPLDDLYSNTSTLFIHDWEEINENFLKEQEKIILSKGFSKEKIYFPFWKNKIEKIQKEIREGKNNFSHLAATKFDQETLSTLHMIIAKYSPQPLSIIVCKGKAQGLRPYQIAKSFDKSKIYTIDDWYTIRKKSNLLKKFSDDPVLKFSVKQLKPSTNLLKTLATFNQPICFLFDLSYHRHSLEEDFLFYFNKISKGSLLCGNGGDDTYVNEILKRLENQLNIKFKIEKNIWYLKK